MDKEKKLKKLESQLFSMVYQWGRVGIIVDENCPAFQDLMDKIKKLN